MEVYEDMKLKIGDEFDKIVDVMNSVFGWNYKACMRGGYAINKEKGIYAWFPKMAVYEQGELLEGDKWYGWINSMSEDGQHIYMINYQDPSRMDLEPIHDKLITFAKEKGKKYTYVGVFERTYRDSEKGWVYNKIADDIEVKDYL